MPGLRATPTDDGHNPLRQFPLPPRLVEIRAPPSRAFPTPVRRHAGPGSPALASPDQRRLRALAEPTQLDTPQFAHNTQNAFRFHTQPGLFHSQPPLVADWTSPRSAATHFTACGRPTINALAHATST